MSNSQSQPRLQGNPAPGGLPFDPSKFEPGTTVTWEDSIQISGYTIKKGPRAGARVLPYLRRVLRQYTIPEPPIKTAKAPPEPTGKAGPWMDLNEYLESKYSQWEFFEVQDPIFRKEPGKELIDTKTLLLWNKPLKDYSMKALGAEEILVVRVWILLYNSNKDEYFVFCRTRSIRLSPEEHRKSLLEMYKAHVDRGYHDQQEGTWKNSLYEDVIEWANEKTDYIQVREILAWTLWLVPTANPSIEEKSPSLHPFHYAPREVKGPSKKRFQLFAD